MPSWPKWSEVEEEFNTEDAIAHRNHEPLSGNSLRSSPRPQGFQVLMGSKSQSPGSRNALLCASKQEGTSAPLGDVQGESRTTRASPDELPSREMAQGRNWALGGRDAVKSPKQASMGHRCRRGRRERTVAKAGNLDPSARNPTLHRAGSNCSRDAGQLFVSQNRQKGSKQA